MDSNLLVHPKSTWQSIISDALENDNLCFFWGIWVKARKEYFVRCDVHDYDYELLNSLININIKILLVNLKSSFLFNDCTPNWYML
jgi:hypothetical protein